MKLKKLPIYTKPTPEEEEIALFNAKEELADKMYEARNVNYDAWSTLVCLLYSEQYHKMPQHFTSDNGYDKDTRNRCLALIRLIALSKSIRKEQTL